MLLAHISSSSVVLNFFATIVITSPDFDGYTVFSGLGIGAKKMWMLSRPR